MTAQQVLAAQTARLEAKRAELQRWDEAAQAKFRQAFGTTDESARQLVLRRIEQQIDQNTKLQAAIAETVSFEFYVQTKRK